MMSSSDSVVWCILGLKVRNMKIDFNTAIRKGKEIYDILYYSAMMEDLLDIF